MAAKLGFELVKRAMLKELMKRGDDGIMLTLPKNELVDLNARITMDRLIKAGIDPDSLTSSDQVINILENINNQIMKNARVISADSAEGKTITDKLFGKKGEVVEFPQKRSFKEEIEAMKKSGDLVDEDKMVISEKITDREMFKNSNLNKRDSVTDTITYIKTLEPMDAMKEANSVIGRKGKYKNLTPEESQRILKETDDHIFERDIPIDPEDMATGGRAGHYTGGIVDVEPSLDDIGHGSDALMARTRLVSPGNQATTSTGLNYLLAEDNDNMRVPFETGLLVEKDKMQPTLEEYLKERGEIERKENSERLYREYLEDMRRKKVMQQKQEAAEGGRIGFAGGNGVADEDAEKAALGKRVRELMDEGFDMGEAVKKAMSEGYAEGGRIGFSAGGAGRRAFLKLLASIGGGVAAAKSGILSLGGKEAGKQTAKEIVKSAGSGTPPPYFFKLVEKIKTLGDDVTVGSSTTPRTKVTKYKNYELTESLDGSKQIQKIGKEDDMITQNEYMTYTKGQADETTKGKKPADDYEEVTETNSRIYKDNFNDPDYEDGINLKEILEEVGETVTKKADGGLTTMLGE